MHAGAHWAIPTRSFKAAATMGLTKFLFFLLAMAVIHRMAIGSPNHRENPKCNVECYRRRDGGCPSDCACVLRDNQTRGRCVDTYVPGFENITGLPPEYGR
uniref:Putative secreted peptide n=1 Tax=Rhipicephalus pulchellus TaxID=72859 RepID=L7MCA7_RHIPC